ncbi:MAG: hypothetical protein ABR880_19565 [Candidatus Sulfotelmatobacter sp.]|jgi:hypothetical protein
MKNATAISHGSSRLLESGNGGEEGSVGLGGLPFVELGCIGLRGRVHQFAENQLSLIRTSIPVHQPLMASRPRISTPGKRNVMCGVFAPPNATFHSWKRTILLIFNTLARRRFHSAHNGASYQF